KICMQAADSALVLIDAIDGIRVQTEQAWDFADGYELPRAIFINKMDKERADLEHTLRDITDTFKPKPILLQLPIGKEEAFEGVVDLVEMKAFVYDGDGKSKVVDIPADMADRVESERASFVENIAETDDELLERYLEGEELTDDEIKAALKKGTISRAFTPVLCGSATKNIAVDRLQHFIVDYMPSPLDGGIRTATDAEGTEIECAPDENEPFSAFVFKTVADPFAGRLTILRIVTGKMGSDGGFFNTTSDNKERYTQLLRLAGKEQKPISEAGPGEIVALAKLKETSTGDTLCDPGRKITFTCAEPLPPLISFALEAKTAGEEDKIHLSLNRLLEEDIALTLTRNAETGETLLSGRGQAHIEAIVEKLKRKFNVEVILNTPKVPYRETVKKKVRVQGRHKKQSGGHGQFGDCWIQMEPLPRGGGFEFVNKIVGGSIPKTYIPAVEKGIVESAVKGILAGYPCVDFRVTLDDGSYHAVDSSEMAFKIAGSVAFKNAVKEARAVLLEPIMKVTVTTPEDFMGDIMGDLNSRRGKVLGMDSAGKNQIVMASVPMSEFLTYSPDLRSMTGGRGTYAMELSHYDEVPFQLAEKIIEAANAKE
ncbi:MAG: elongation factor G, partial [Desulfobacterales bacterium]